MRYYESIQQEFLQSLADDIREELELEGASLTDEVVKEIASKVDSLYENLAIRILVVRDPATFAALTATRISVMDIENPPVYLEVLYGDADEMEVPGVIGVDFDISKPCAVIMMVDEERLDTDDYDMCDYCGFCDMDEEEGPESADNADDDAVEVIYCCCDDYADLALFIYVPEDDADEAD
jgi:hypothetical protein